MRGPFLIFRKAKAVSPPSPPHHMAGLGGCGGRVCLSMQPVLKCWNFALPEGGAGELANRTFCLSLSLLPPLPAPSCDNGSALF